MCFPECPPGQVLSTCATLCPSLCSHLQPGTICVQEPCQLGCSCPGGQVSQATGFLSGGERRGSWGGMGLEPSMTEPLHLSCYTMARASPLLAAPALSSPCPGASPYPWKSRPRSCPQGQCSSGTAHTGEGPEPGWRAGLLRVGWGGGTEAAEQLLLSS